ncbi:hypothetical protein DENSPDRAFT_840272 [Dentipellis sp. KUC8613]|nr:hypothetical protein DENSPDRAFT_840272 [Dentipellis sp. KUC8613]
MSSADNAKGASKSIPQLGPSTSEATPSVQRESNRPRSKHATNMRQIRLDCLAALKRKNTGEITHQEFMRIAHECLERKEEQKAKFRLICERARRGDVSPEEFQREVGHSDEDWEKVRPEAERHAQILVANVKRGRVGTRKNRSSRGH